MRTLPMATLQEIYSDLPGGYKTFKVTHPSCKNKHNERDIYLIATDEGGSTILGCSSPRDNFHKHTPHRGEVGLRVLAEVILLVHPQDPDPKMWELYSSQDE